MTIKIANAPCSWGVDYAEDVNNPLWTDVFKEISNAGYNHCEIGPFGFLPEDEKKTMCYLNELNLNVVGGFIFDHLHQPNHYSRIKSKIISTCSFLNKLKGEVFVIIDHISEKRMKTSGNMKISQDLPYDTYKDMVIFLQEVCRIVKEEYNLIPVLHPHAGTYIEYDHEIDRLINDINSDYIGLCLDTAHLTYSGINPYNAILKYNTLVKHMHFKDIKEDILAKVHHNNIDFDTAVSEGVFVPLGAGMIEFKKIYKNLQEINYDGFATIEQDIDPTLGLNAIDYAKKSLTYLSQFY
jgi:inosose dehydratase